MSEYIKRVTRPKALVWIFLVIAVISIIYNITLSEKINRLENPQAFAQAQVQKVVAEISKFMILPTNETPTLATVSDPSQLKNQPFFANAQSGDQVLVYVKAARAILWRPSEQKIVEVAPISSSSSPAR